MVYELRKVGTSAADLKSLHRKRRNEPRYFKSKSGTRNIKLLVPMAFRSSQTVIAEMVYELRKVGTSRLSDHIPKKTAQEIVPTKPFQRLRPASDRARP